VTRSLAAGTHGGRAWLRVHLGRRGLALVVFSLVFTVTGLAAIIEPAQDDGRYILYTMLPIPFRLVLWFVPAALGLWAAFRGTGRDGFGFAALVIPASVVSLSYAWSGVFYAVGITDYSLGWTGTARWLLVLALILIVSGWKEAEEAEEAQPTPTPIERGQDA